MAGYAFESMSQADAASFTADDFLFFTTPGSTANQVQVEAYTNGSSGSTSGSGITLTFNGTSLTFPNTISDASQNPDGHLIFRDDSHLIIGTQADGETLGAIGSTDVDGNFTDPQVAYALGGDDTLDFSGSREAVSNYLNGGFGADTIDGGDANNHIYGNSQFSQQGATDGSSKVVDGSDLITVGGGSNYINGNAGADTITVGTAATAGQQGEDDSAPATNGFNRVYGGGDSDTVTINGDGHNYVNGNMGNDTLTDTGMGDNTLRGGSGNDTITGGAGHNVLMGDVGNDYIIVNDSVDNDVNSSGTGHISVLTGGTGSDLFDFGTAGSGTASTFGQVTYYQEITDYQQGTDHIAIVGSTAGTQGNAGTSGVEAGEVGHSNTIFDSVHDAELYAQSQLTGDGNNQYVVSSLAVGNANNTYLFYTDAAAVDPSTNGIDGIGIIHLDNVTASTISYTDFSATTVTAA